MLHDGIEKIKDQKIKDGLEKILIKGQERMSVVTIPLSDLRRDLSTIVPNLTQPIFVTQRGRVKAVLIDIEAYNDILDELDDARLMADPEFQASLAEAQAGGGKPLEDVLQRYGL